MQDPQIQLKELGVTLSDPIDPARQAVLDAEHRSFVNWETYFFADLDTKRRFDADPLRWCGILTDPVTRHRFRPGSRAPRSDFDGRVYFFYDEAGKKAFDAQPETYARANFDMVPM